MFCPKSNTQTPDAGLVMQIGVKVSTTLTGSAVRATSLVARFGGGAMSASTGSPTPTP
jgi:hypothetical protein